MQDVGHPSLLSQTVSRARWEVAFFYLVCPWMSLDSRITSQAVFFSPEGGTLFTEPSTDSRGVSQGELAQFCMAVEGEGALGRVLALRDARQGSLQRLSLCAPCLVLPVAPAPQAETSGPHEPLPASAALRTPAASDFSFPACPSCSLVCWLIHSSPLCRCHSCIAAPCPSVL